MKLAKFNELEFIFFCCSTEKKNKLKTLIYIIRDGKQKFTYLSIYDKNQKTNNLP